MILFATDGSSYSKLAGETVSNLLEAFPNAKLLVMYVIKPFYAGVDFGGFPQVVEDYETQITRRIEDEIMQTFERFPGRVTFRHIYGDPVFVICEAAEKHHADLIVIGSHGRGALDRLLLGSVSSGVVQRSTTTVMVVK